MDTKVLEYIIAIADEKKITKAADLFYLTQPVLSRHLKNIEAELGTRLFYRKNGEMCLTDAGRIYINSARAILYTEQKLLQELADIRREGRNVLRMIVDPYLMRFFYRSVLPDFESLHTGYELEITEGNLTIATAVLQNDLADFSIVRASPSDIAETKLEAELLFSDEIVLTVPRNWALVSGNGTIQTTDPWNYPEQSFLMESTDSTMRLAEQRILQRFQFRPRSVFEISGSATAMQMVKEERGVAFLPKALAEAHSPYVSALSFDPPEEFNIYFLYHPRTVLRDTEKSLLRILKEQYGRMDEYMRHLAEDANNLDT